MLNNNGTFCHNGAIKVPKDFCFSIGKTEQRTLVLSGSIDIFLSTLLYVFITTGLLLSLSAAMLSG